MRINVAAGLIFLLVFAGCEPGYITIIKEVQGPSVTVTQMGWATQTLPPSIVTTTVTAPGRTITVSSFPASQTPTAGNIVFSNASYIISERNNSWWRFSWKFTASNNTSGTFHVYAEVQFLDTAGYELDYSLAEATLNAQQSQEITGSSLIGVGKAEKIASIKVSLA